MESRVGRFASRLLGTWRRYSAGSARAIHLGDDAPGLRWRWLHGLSSAQPIGCSYRSLIVSPYQSYRKAAFGRSFVCIPVVTGLDAVQDRRRLVELGLKAKAK
jgi:hypothetical protein